MRQNDDGWEIFYSFKRHNDGWWYVYSRDRHHIGGKSLGGAINQADAVDLAKRMYWETQK